VFKAASKRSAYHVTKDGLHPGSALDHYERGTRWVGRHQRAMRDQHADRCAQQECSCCLAREERGPGERERERVSSLHSLLFTFLSSSHSLLLFSSLSSRVEEREREVKRREEKREERRRECVCV
jgi:hypothetical protein